MDKWAVSVAFAPFDLVVLFLVDAVIELWLKRQDVLPVSTIWQWCVKRSSSAVVIFASANTAPHSPKLKFVVTITLVRS